MSRIPCCQIKSANKVVDEFNVTLVCEDGTIITIKEEETQESRMSQELSNVDELLLQEGPYQKVRLQKVRLLKSNFL